MEDFEQKYRNYSQVEKSVKKIIPNLYVLSFWQILSIKIRLETFLYLIYMFNL